MLLRKIAAPCRFDKETDCIRIGLVVLATDLTSEHDLYQLCATSGVRIHVTRTEYNNPVTPENLAALKDGLTHAVGLLVPEVPLQLIYFSCTSAGALLGDAVVRQQIQTVRAGVPVITPLMAASEAFKALQVKRLSILTPYTADVAKPVGNYFEERNIAVPNISSMGLTDDREMARLAPESIVTMAEECIAPDADALFISCTALRSVQVILRIEEAIGRPVVTSNQAAAWLAARLGHFSPAGREYGVLMSV